MKPPRGDLKKTLRGLLRFPKRVSLWMRVSDTMRRGNWPLAEVQLQRFFADLELPIPSRDAPLDMNLAASVIYYWTDQGEQSLQALDATIDQLRAGRAKPLTEASYFARYCTEFAEFCAGRFPAYETEFLTLADRAEAQTVPFNLRKVPESVRTLFPLSNTPH